MDDTANRLLEIQKIDSARMETERQLEAYPRRLRSLKNNVDQARRQIEDAERQLKETRARRKLLETEIAQKQESLRKYAGQQMQVKTNKEYQAVEHQMASVKEAIDEQENQVLEALEVEETLETRVAERREALVHAERDLDLDQKRISGLEVEKRGRLEALNRERRTYVDQLPEEWLETYTNLFERYPGDAITDSDGKTCSGCNWNLLPQVAQKLGERKDLVPCHHCARLLYLRQ